MRGLRLGIGAVLALCLGLPSLAMATPAAAAPGTGAPSVISVPDEAMLQPADLGGVETMPAADDLRPWLRPPQPCALYRSAALRGADRAVEAVYPVGDVRPTVLLEYVAVYRGGGAAQYLRELTRAVTRCSGCTDTGRTWQVVGTGIAGRHSLLLSVRETVGYEGDNRVQTSYVAVARTGHAIVVLADIGWEIGDGHEAVVRDLAPVAVARAAVVG
ncbi:hypothetical protein [Actinoplanes sp. NPDC020271]|uniref:hypothetical protein n=1 Tax=Actinoplanes sp. NPDC020271 TaxID=3363896 RepID=UPI0037963FB0